MTSEIVGPLYRYGIPRQFVVQGPRKMQLGRVCRWRDAVCEGCVYVARIYLATVWYDASSCSESGRAVVAYSSLVKLLKVAFCF